MMQPTSYKDCANISEAAFKSLSLARDTTAGFCLLLCFLTLTLICISRSWKSIHERLFLYLTASTVFYLAVLTMHIEHYFHYTWQDRFCIAVGFLDQYSGSVQLLFTWWITLFLFVDVSLKLKGRDYASLVPACFPGCWRGQKCASVLECILVTLAIVCPIISSVLPFLLVSYGETGPWCWIRTLEHNSCKQSAEGFWEQMGLWYIPFGVVALCSLLFILLMFVLLICWMLKFPALQVKIHGLKSSVAETCLLVLFLIVYFVLFSIEITGRIISSIDNIFWVWMLYAISTPLSGAILPIAFFIYRFNKVIRSSIVKCLRVPGSCCELIARCCRLNRWYQELGEASQREDEPGSVISSPDVIDSVTCFDPEALFHDRHHSDQDQRDQGENQETH